MGWSYLHYEDGWPVAKLVSHIALLLWYNANSYRATGLMDNSSSGIRPNYMLNVFIFMCMSDPYNITSTKLIG